jgi:hypothetical protein
MRRNYYFETFASQSALSLAAPVLVKERKMNPRSRCVCYGSAVCNTSRRDGPDRFPQKERETSPTQPRMKNASGVYRHRDGGPIEINISIVRRHVIDFIKRPARNELRWIDERPDIDRSEIGGQRAGEQGAGGRDGTRQT